MRRTKSTRSAAPVLAAVLTALLVTAGCGDVEVTSDDDTSADKAESTPSADSNADVDTSAGEGNWLLGMPDGRRRRRRDQHHRLHHLQPLDRAGHGPQAARRRRPPAPRPTQAALLVSADRHWAIPDTEIPAAGEERGQLKVYSLADGTTKVVDIRERTGEDDVKAIGWAFDPERAGHAAGRGHQEPGLGGRTSPAARPPRRARCPRAPGCSPTASTPTPASRTWRASTATRPSRRATASPTPRRSPATAAPCSPTESDGLTKLPASPCRLGAALHRRRRRHLGLLRGPAGADDLLPAQGRREVDRLRQAEHRGGPGRRRRSRSCFPPRRKRCRGSARYPRRRDRPTTAPRRTPT